MTRFAINIKKAISMMFDAGFSEEEVINHIKNLRQPTPGFVYTEDVPVTPSIKEG